MMRRFSLSGLYTPERSFPDMRWTENRAGLRNSADVTVIRVILR
jgi:hypothetical protein